MKQMVCTIAAWCLVLVGASAARADPFVVTGGSMTINGAFRTASFTLIGDGFNLTASGDQAIGFKCFPCTTSQTTNLGGFVTGAAVGNVAGTWNGVAYPAITLNSTLAFTSPDFNLSGLSGLTTTQPFTMA